MPQTSSYRDGERYDRISAPLERIGREVLDRLPLAGDETVLDAGCGSGRVTQALLERLPDGHVIGVDGSPEMLAAARRRLGEGVELILADLQSLDLRGRHVDAVLSLAANLSRHPVAGLPACLDGRRWPDDPDASPWRPCLGLDETGQQG